MQTACLRSRQTAADVPGAQAVVPSRATQKRVQEAAIECVPGTRCVHYRNRQRGLSINFSFGHQQRAARAQLYHRNADPILQLFESAQGGVGSGDGLSFMLVRKDEIAVPHNGDELIYRSFWVPAKIRRDRQTSLAKTTQRGQPLDWSSQGAGQVHMAGLAEFSLYCLMIQQVFKSPVDWLVRHHHTISVVCYADC
jgi:hypothetical protein